MRGWFGQQRRALGGALRSLARSPLATLFNVVVVAIALALPAALYVGLTNLQQAARAASPEPQLTVFLALDATPVRARELEALLEANSLVANSRYVPREQALEEMKRASGMQGIAESLGHNPLPDAFVLTSRDPTPVALQRLQTEIAALPGVASVQVDSEWAQRLDALLRLGRTGLALLAGLLAFALIAVTFNTIRLQILTQREEIEVASLIGATPGFIRKPFLYYGAFLGVLGAGVACALLWLLLDALNAGLAELSYLYGGRWQLRYLNAADAVSLLVFAAVLGWLGAWLSVTRHLARMQSR